MSWIRRTTISRDEALAARPIKSGDAMLSASDDGKRARLSMPVIVPRGFRWLFRYSIDAKRTFEIDATGLLVWQMCNGRNPVRKIAKFVAMQTNAGTGDAETATLKFMQMLESRNLIHVKPDE